MRHHMVTIPYENLALHYLPHQRIRSSDVTLDVQEIYSLNVEGCMGRGEHCLQMNGVFGTVLRSLGFDVMSTAARINTACQDIARSPEYKVPSYIAFEDLSPPLAVGSLQRSYSRLVTA